MKAKHTTIKIIVIPVIDNSMPSPVENELCLIPAFMFYDNNLKIFQLSQEL